MKICRFVSFLLQLNICICNENVLVQLFRHPSSQNVCDDKNLALMFQENEMLHAEKEKLVTENKELLTNIGVALAEIKALISQRSAVFGDDSSSSTVSYQVYTISYYLLL